VSDIARSNNVARLVSRQHAADAGDATVFTAGRSAKMPLNRLGTEITHCRTGTGGMT
jgi:hypothetical protein